MNRDVSSTRIGGTGAENVAQYLMRNTSNSNLSPMQMRINEQYGSNDDLGMVGAKIINSTKR